MNTEMLNAEPTQTHLKTLSTRGILVAATGVGDLACGESGAGRLLEPNEVIAQITHQAADSAAMRVRGRQILITGGATREKIDGVRFISNISTGKTAAALCDYFSKNGWDVTYVHGEQAAQPKCHVNEIQFSSVENLDRALHRELGEGNYAAVIHAAAVSDFTVDPINGKISSRTHLNLDLKPTKKILPSLKEYSRNNQLKVIGFKLLLNSTKEDLQAAADKVLKSGADAVVANDLSQLSEDRELHPGFLWAENELREFRTVYEMGNLICEFLTLRESL